MSGANVCFSWRKGTNYSPKTEIIMRIFGTMEINPYLCTVLSSTIVLIKVGEFTMMCALPFYIRLVIGPRHLITFCDEISINLLQPLLFLFQLLLPWV